MTLFELVAKISADSSEFDSAVGKAEKSGRSLKDSLTSSFDKIKKVAATAISVAAIKKGIDAVIDLANEVAAAGDRIDKQSQVLGLSRKAYQEWDYILSQNGASIENMSASMKTLNNLVISASEGGKEAKEAFSKLGLGFHEIENLNPEDQFEAVVRAFQKMPAGAKKSALAVQIFGRGGMSLLPLLNQAETSIDELRQRAEELGLYMSDEAVDASVVYGDSLDDLKRTFSSFKYAVGAQILPVLTKGIQGITNYAGKLRKAYDERGFAGVWDTLVNDFKNIKWPTWDDVSNAITIAWQTIQDGFSDVAKFVFGTTEDGGIKWPTATELWQKTKEALQTLWDGYQAYAGTILKLVFGETEDGGIQFPTVNSIADKVSEGLRNLWDALKSGGLNEILKITFGENEDGGIKFPDPQKILDIILTPFKIMWTPLAGVLSGIAKFTFGETEDGGIAFPSWEEIWEKIRVPLETLWIGIKGAASDILKLVFGEDENGGINFAPVEEVWAKISGAAAIWWEGIKQNLKSILVFVLDLFGLPSYEEMVAKIRTWWDTVKTAVGSLFVDIVPRILGIGGTGNDDYNPGDSSYGRQYWDVPQHAKGLPNVPYDNYVARLHKGERVLTRSENRRYSKGGTGIDMSEMINGIVSAVQEGMADAQVNSYMDGRRVTGSVNRTTMNQLRARRFVTT